MALEGNIRPRLPTPQECALLLLRLLELRNEENPVSRVRLSELTLRRLWTRGRLSDDFLNEVQEWLSRGGWTLFFAQSTYAVVKTNVVLSWSRLASKRMNEDIQKVRQGTFDFGELVRLIETDDDIEE
jgi:hypothetical protein